MLKTRITTALILVAVLIPALLFASSFIWALIMLLVAALAIAEWARLIDLPQTVARTYGVMCIVLGSILLWMMVKHGSHWLLYQSILAFLVSAVFWLLFVPVLLKRRIVIENKTGLMLIGFLVVLPFWLALVFVKSVDAKVLLGLMTTIWIADSAAYFSGKHFGRHKLAPSISPGKTWEGVWGALFAVTLFAAALCFFNLVNEVLIFPLLWMTALLGVVGDLFESLIKRQFGKKDSGNMLPGHGGILDRIDGLLPSLPIAALAIYLFHYIQAAT